MFHRTPVQTAEKHSETVATSQKHCQSVLGASKSFVKMEQIIFMVFMKRVYGEYNYNKSILSSLKSIHFLLIPELASRSH